MAFMHVSKFVGLTMKAISKSVSPKLLHLTTITNVKDSARFIKINYLPDNLQDPFCFMDYKKICYSEKFHLFNWSL